MRDLAKLRNSILLSFIFLSDEPTEFPGQRRWALCLLLNWGGVQVAGDFPQQGVPTPVFTQRKNGKWLTEHSTIAGYSMEREVEAIARKKKFTKVDNDEGLGEAGGNKNAGDRSTRDATTNFWGQTVSRRGSSPVR
jgi:hypothetical protein